MQKAVQQEVKVAFHNTASRIPLLNTPTTVDFADLGDKKTGSLISQEGCELLKFIAEDMYPGLYSREQLRQIIKNKRPDLTDLQLKEVFPYFPRIIIDYRYSIYTTPFKPEESSIAADTLTIYSENFQLYYMVKDQSGAIHQSHIKIGKADDANIQLDAKDQIILLSHLSSIGAQRSDDEDEEEEKSNNSSTGTLWNITANYSDLNMIFCIILRLAESKNHIPPPAIQAIYRGDKHALGRGAYGKAILAFDIREKKWIVDKVQSAENRKVLIKHCAEELKAARELGYSSGQLIKYQKDNLNNPNPGKNIRYHFTMDYVDGIQLDKFLFNHRNLSLFNLIQIAISILKALQKILQKKYLHLDIKLQNILFNPITSEATFIDLGFAIKTHPKTDHTIQKMPEHNYELNMGILYITTNDDGIYYEILNREFQKINQFIPFKHFTHNFPRDLDDILSSAAAKLEILSHARHLGHTDKEVAYSTYKGTAYYCAPEVLESRDERVYGVTSDLIEYSETTEIHATGVILEKLFGITPITSKIDINGYYLTPLLNYNQATQLRSLVKRMKNKRPSVRSTVMAAIKELESIQHKLLPISSKVIMLLNVSDYLACSSNEIDAFHHALKSADLVLLYDHPGQHKDIFEVSLLRSTLISNGIFIDNVIYKASISQQFIAKLKLDYEQRDSEETILHYYCFLHSHRIKTKNIADADFINVLQHPADYFSQIKDRAIPVSNQHLKQVRSMLEDNISRLQKKILTEKILDKLVHLRDYYRVFINRNDDSITYVMLLRELNQLQNAIMKERTKIENFLFTTPTRVKKIELVKSVIEQGVDNLRSDVLRRSI